jgi:hypothetical protein
MRMGGAYRVVLVTETARLLRPLISTIRWRNSVSCSILERLFPLSSPMQPSSWRTRRPD